MRLILQLGTQKVYVFPKDRFVEFNDLEQAAEFIADHVVEPQNLRALREALRREEDYAKLLTFDLTELIVGVAKLLLNRELRFLPDPGQMNPWRWSFAPTPTFDIEGQGKKLSLADLAIEDLKGKLPDPGYLDIIPDPIVPPEFPRMAAAETEALDDQSDRLQDRMDLLRFVGSSTPPKGEIAPAVLDLARSEGSALSLTVGGAGGALIPLTSSAFEIPPKSGVGPVFGRLSGNQGDALGEGSDRVGLKLEDTLAGGGAERLPSELAAAFPELSSSQGVFLKGQTKDTANGFAGFVGPQQDPPAPSLLSRELRDGGLRTGVELGNRTRGVNEDLEAVTGGEGLVDPNASEISSAMTRFGKTNADLVGNNTSKVGRRLGGLLGGESGGPADPSEISNAVATFGRQNADIVGDNAARVSRDMDALLGGEQPHIRAEEGVMGPRRPATSPKRKQIARLESQPTPLDGERNRSSDDFSTLEVPENCRRLLWQVKGEKRKEISFDVMESKFLWRDPTHLFGVKHGQKTKVIRDKKLYIARPSQAGKTAFTVTVFAILDD